MNDQVTRRRTLFTLIGILVSVLVVFQACNTTSGNGNNEVRYYAFTANQNDTEGDNFIVKTSDPQVIDRVEAQLDLPREQRDLHIHGDIAKGNPGYNKDWSWHFVPGQWALAEVSAEVCDGTPQMVEQNLEYWTQDVGMFCPWSSIVLREVNVNG